MSDPTIEQRLAAIEAAQSKPAPAAAPVAANAAPAPQSPESIAAIVAATIQAMQPQQPQHPAPAAAPAAPSTHQPIGRDISTGLVDPFSPGVAAQLGPRGVRKALEDLWAVAADRSGAPNRPKPPR